MAERSFAPTRGLMARMRIGRSTHGSYAAQWGDRAADWTPNIAQAATDLREWVAVLRGDLARAERAIDIAMRQ